MTDALTEEALFELLSVECRVDTDGTAYYYNKQGQLHRVYGPAVEYSDGSRAWWQNGRLHRIDSPAVMHGNGGRHEWWQNGLPHRLDGPAIVCTDGYRAWFQNGKRHRADGPAVEYEDGYREWHINGKELTEAEWQQEVTSMENVCLKHRLTQ